MRPRFETLEHVSILLKERLLRVYPEEVSEPGLAAALFFDEVPESLLAQRKERLDRRAGAREWFLVTEDAEPEWADSLRGEYGVLVVDVEDLEEARSTLRSFRSSVGFAPG